MYVGASVLDALTEATRLRNHLSGCTVLEVDDRSDFVDTLFGLCVLIEGRVRETASRLTEIQGAYDLVSTLLWPDDGFGERREILTRLALAGWNHCRRCSTYPEAMAWRDRCVALTLEDEVVRSFLSIPFVERSPELNSRFLADPAILLATCVQFENERNQSPAAVARDAPVAYAWLRKRQANLDEREDLEFMSGDLAVSVSVGLKHVGVSAATTWLDRAEEHFKRTLNPEPYLASTTFLRATEFQDRHEFEEVLALLPPVIATMQRHGMTKPLNYARLLEALALKDTGQPALALERLMQLSVDLSVRANPLAFGLVLITIAELRARSGVPESALRIFRDALPVVEQAGSPIVTGQFHGTLGEVLRDQGRLKEAESAYRLSIASYSGAGMCRREAYMRVILAETLLADDRQVEAIAELLAALPTISREKLLREGSAAVALLDEALRQQKVSVSLLREVREQLSTARGVDQR